MLVGSIVQTGKYHSVKSRPPLQVLGLGYVAGAARVL